MDLTTDTKALCEAAQQHLQKKEIADAIDLYEQAIEIDERCYEAHDGIATAYYLGKDYLSAVEHFKRLTLLRPMDGKALINLGCVLNLLKRYPEAVKALQKGSLKEKKSFEAFYNLGLAYRGVNQASMAMTAYKEAIRLSPDDPDTHQNIANTYLDMKNYQKAIEHYKKAIELKPGFQKALIGLENAISLKNESKQSNSPFGRLVDTTAQSKAVSAVGRELSLEERHDDRVEVRTLTRKGEETSKALLSVLVKEFEPTILKLNRSVAEVTDTPWELTETSAQFRELVAKSHLLRKQLKQKMSDLQVHEQLVNTPKIS